MFAMKWLAGFFILAGMIFLPAAVSHADSGLSFEYNHKAYTIEQASSPQSDFPFELELKDGVLLLSDQASGLQAAIRENSLDNAAMEAVRKYYNDYSSIDFEIFTKYIGLQKSYIPALQDLYHSSYLYGNTGDPYSETNMKVFYQDKDQIFGNNSDVFLYNIINSDKLDSQEETHLDMVIPVYSDLSLISINFTFKAGSLNQAAEEAVYKLLGCMRFPDFPVQAGKLKVFEKKDAVLAANAGIYKAAGNNSGDLTEMRNEKAGFTLKYPASYLPYMKNSIGGRLDYESLKISPSQIFSVSSEQTSIPEAVYDKASYVKEFYKQDITVIKEGSTAINGNQFVFLNYELKDNNGIVSYISDYFTAGRGHIYNLRLTSRYKNASEESKNEFKDILGSFTVSEPETAEVKNDVPLKKYLNKEEGYSFFYPVKWKLADTSKDLNFDSLTLKIPELSGPIDINISEGELKAGIKAEAFPSILSGLNSDSLNKYIRNYTPPYAGVVNKLLSHSTVKESGVTYIYRLVNYMDSNGRSRLCYSTDIVKKNKVYSMFVSVSEYSTANGSVSDPAVNTLIENIAASFQYDETQESYERDKFGETRNRKVVNLESLLKTQLGQDAKIVQAKNSSVRDSYYLLVEGIEDSGYYLVRPDYAKSTLLIEEKILKKDCQSFLEKYLSTSVDVYFTSGDDFRDMEKHRDASGHYAAVVYAVTQKGSGFFILDIDSYGQFVKVISFKSSSILAEEISAGIAQNAETGFIIDHSIDKKDFTLSFHFYSSIKGHFFESYNVTLDPESLKLKYSKN